MKKPDYTKLDKDFVKQLDSLKSGTVAEQVQDLKDATMRGFRAIAQESKFSELEQADLLTKMGELLTQSQKSLTALLERPETKMPDNKPLIDAIQSGFDNMRKDLAKIEVKPQVNVDVPTINVPEVRVPEIPTPNVGVTVDNREVAKVIKQLPGIFESAIQAIEQPDFSDIARSIENSNRLLEDVRKNTAFKPQAPTTIKVTNTDGSSLSSGAKQADYSIDNIDSTTTAGTTYYTFFDSSDNWYVLRDVGGVTFSYASVLNNSTLTSKALFQAADIDSLTYGTKGDAF